MSRTSKRGVRDVSLQKLLPGLSNLKISNYMSDTDYLSVPDSSQIMP